MNFSVPLTLASPFSSHLLGPWCVWECLGSVYMCMWRGRGTCTKKVKVSPFVERVQSGDVEGVRAEMKLNW